MHRLEHRRVRVLRVEVAGRGHAEPAGHGGGEVAEDVAEQVGPHDDVEPVGGLHHPGGQGVDVARFGGHVRVLGRDGVEDLVPERHRVDDAVRLGRRAHPLRPGARQVEGVADDPFDTDAGEHRLLQGELARVSRVVPAAEGGVLALRVLPDDHHLQLVGPAPGQRRGGAGQQPHRPQVDVLGERAAQRDQQAPQRHVVGHAREADRAEQDRVESGQRGDAVVGHHRAGAQVPFAAVVELRPAQGEPVCRRRGVQHPAGLGGHVHPDAVTGDGGDPVRASVPGGRGPVHRTPGRHRLTATYLVSRNSSIPRVPPSRPRPDCLTPPNGAAGLDTTPWFRPTMPVSSFSLTRSARLTSRV